MKCQNCKKELKQTPGKRAKIFCDSTCRSNFWQKAKRKIDENNKPENKAKIEKERIVASGKSHKKPLMPDDCLSPKIQYTQPTPESYDGPKLNTLFIIDELSQFPTLKQDKIKALQAEYDAIPDKTKGLGKKRAEFLLKEIDKSKYGK